MEVLATSNASEYRDALIDFIATFRVSVRQALKYQGRLLGERTVAFTPPRNQRQGKEAVDTEIRKVILGLDDGRAFANPQNVIAGDDTYVKAFLGPNDSVYGITRELLKSEPSDQELDAWHKRFRNRRGKISGNPLPNSKQEGGWTLIRKLVIPANRLEAYIRKVQANVGRAKGGWAKGVLALGGRVAQWIAIHSDRTGSFVDQTDQSDPSLIFINRSEWASGGDQDRIIDNAISARTRDIHNSILRARKEASKSIFS